MRAGLHVGECEIKANTIRGTAVEASRLIAQEAEAMEILVSRTIRDLVAGSGIRFEPKGQLELTGYGSLHLLRVDVPDLN